MQNSPTTLVWTVDPYVSPRPLAAVPVTDRGFRYGMSVFETIAFQCSRLLFLSEHIDRLCRACAAAGFPEPRHVTPALLQSLLDAHQPDGVLRLYVTAGDGAPTAPVTASRNFALYESATIPAEDYKLAISRAPFSGPLGGWKTGNYWPHIQALAEARRLDGDEALVFNAGGAMVSAAMANVFLVLDGKLCTPALSSGARDGVVRAWVQGIAHAEEVLLTIDDVARAEECFLTNSRLGVKIVSQLDGRALPSRAFGDMLAVRYRDEFLGA